MSVRASSYLYIVPDNWSIAHALSNEATLEPPLARLFLQKQPHPVFCSTCLWAWLGFPGVCGGENLKRTE